MNYQPPPPDAGNFTLDALRSHGRQIAQAVRWTMLGKLNAVADFTCTANAASTTFEDSRLSVDSAVLFDPTSANAAAELAAGTLYVTTANRNNKTWTVTHANAASTDRTFRVLIIG